MKTAEELTSEIKELQNQICKEFCLNLFLSEKEHIRYKSLMDSQNLLLRERKQRFQMGYND